VDGFKAINDTYGHEAGDSVLKVLAAQLQSSIRDIDFLARYGGDEFAVILPETRAEEAAILAERLKKTVSNHPVSIDSSFHTISVSTGVADITSDLIGNEHTLVHKADKVLYRDKAQGGYRVNSEL
jgi:diguanylate cyclase (GGDEF)-like protein